MSELKLTPAQRVLDIPPYVFARIDEIKQAALKEGKKLTNLGIGDPDLPTPQFIIDRFERAIKNPVTHRYPPYAGLPQFRTACAKFLKNRFDINVNPEKEVLALIGTKEGIAHLPLALVNPGEGVLVPDPGYPVYASATILAGGVPVYFSLKEKNGFLPDFAELETLIKRGPKIKLWYLNYPNNPTAASASVEFFEEAARFAKKHEIWLCHDNAYSEIYYEDQKQPSFLQAPTAREVGIECQSFSKTFNMAGWRVGFAAGNERLLATLLKIKTVIDSGVFNACQEAAIGALEEGEQFCRELRQIYQKRRDLMVPLLRKAGLTCPSPSATFYLWANVPKGKTSEQLVMEWIREKQIVTTPGNGFGPSGEGYVRFALCQEESVLKQVAESLSRSL